MTENKQSVVGKVVYWQNTHADFGIFAGRPERIGFHFITVNRCGTVVWQKPKSIGVLLTRALDPNCPSQDEGKFFELQNGVWSLQPWV